MEQRIKMIEEILRNGRLYSWDTYAEQFGAKDGRQANDWWRYYERTGNKAPVFSEEKEVEDNEESILNLPEGAQILGGWVKDSKQSLRFKVDSNDEFDLAKFRGELVEQLSTFSPKVDNLHKDLVSEIYYEISLPDMHFGKEPIYKTIDNFKQGVYELVSRVSHYKVAKFILPIGNDIFNSDQDYRTTKGTPQFDYANWMETWRAVWTTVIEVITSLSKQAPVDVIMVQGNHDFHKVHYLGDVIHAWFHNDENVSVNNTFETRKYYQFGKNLIMYEHGELKWDKYPLLMATERPMMFAKSENREVHLGHFHKEIVADGHNGIMIRHLPSLCPNDLWHKKMGYSAKRKAQALKWHYDYGIIGYEEIKPWRE